MRVSFARKRKKNRRAPDPEALYHRVDVLADLGGGARREAG